MGFINLTPHPISVVNTRGEKETFPTSGVIARVAAIPGENLEEWDGVPMQAVGSFTDVLFFQDHTEIPQTSLPDPGPGGVRYIVSLLVAEALKAQGHERLKFCRPDTGPDAIRENGQVVAVRRFIKA